MTGEEDKGTSGHTKDKSESVTCHSLESLGLTACGNYVQLHVLPAPSSRWVHHSVPLPAEESTHTAQEKADSLPLHAYLAQRRFGERIESTMEAFTHAVEVGTEMLELDCHLTQDGHVIVSHDENLLRQTGLDANISDLNLEDLPLYKEQLEVTFHTGHYSTGSDRRFALLEDIFRRFPRMPVNIEVKEHNMELIEKVSSLVKKYNREDITVWASVESSIMKECRKVNSTMPYMFTEMRGLQLLLLYYTGLLPFVTLGESFLQYYLPQVINTTYIPDPGVLRNRFVISLIQKLTLRKGLFQHLKDRGIQIHLFVCNEERDIEAAFAAGATGVMTDYPTLLSDYIRRHRQAT